jgi:hypothetical protein
MLLQSSDLHLARSKQMLLPCQNINQHIPEVLDLISFLIPREHPKRPKHLQDRSMLGNIDWTMETYKNPQPYYIRMQ